MIVHLDFPGQKGRALAQAVQAEVAMVEILRVFLAQLQAFVVIELEAVDRGLHPLVDVRWQPERRDHLIPDQL